MPLSPNGLCEARPSQPGPRVSREPARPGSGSPGIDDVDTLAARRRQAPTGSSSLNAGVRVREEGRARHDPGCSPPSARASSVSGRHRRRLESRRCRTAAPSVLSASSTESLTSFLQAVLLALLLPRVASEHARLLEVATKLALKLDEAPGDAEAESACLTRDPAAVDRRVHVVTVGGGAGYAQRLGCKCPVGLRGKYSSNALLLIVMAPSPVRKRSTRDRALAAAGRLDEWLAMRPRSPSG